MKWFSILLLFITFSLYAQSPALSSETDSYQTEKAHCMEENSLLLNKFIPLDFDKGRSTVGIDQTLPVKQLIIDFINSYPDKVITSIALTSTSSKIPFYKRVLGKDVIDPDSDERNKKLAQERSVFCEKALNELKSSHSGLSNISIVISYGLAGPNFLPLDLNDRFVTKFSPSYESRVLKVFNENKELLEREALIKSPDELLDESRFVNLYQAKYRPYQGFSISVYGHTKEAKKCGEAPSKVKSSPTKKVISN